jgi:excisionase family DNA binding protein
MPKNGFDPPSELGVPSLVEALRELVRAIVREELARHEEPRALSVAEAARRLGISRSAAYEAVARGDLVAVRVGRRRVVPEAEVRRLLAEEGGR